MATIKTFKQYSYPKNGIYPNTSTNILDVTSVVTLGIHALPGTTFSLVQNSNSNQQFKIGPTGNLTLDCSENPIKELYLISPIVHNTTPELLMYPIIIDVEYLTEGGSN